MKTKPVPTCMFLVVDQLKLHVETSKKAQFTTFNVPVRHKNIRTASKPCHFRLQKKPRFRFDSVSSTHRGFGSGFGYRNNTTKVWCVQW